MDTDNGAIDKMMEKHDKNMGFRTVFSKPFMYAAGMAVSLLLVIGILFVLAGLLLLRVKYIAEEIEPDLLATVIVTDMMSVVIILYVIQAFTAIAMSLKSQEKRVVEVHNEWKEVRLDGSSLFKWTIDDAFHNNGPWIFLIVAIFLPVVLSVIPDIISMFANDNFKISSGSFLTETKFKTTGIIYYLCLSLIAVFITIEASILMSLKDIAGVWIGMILAAMILDITSFLILYGMGDPREEWDGKKFEVSGAEFIFVLAYVCTISSLLTIMFARASREMIFEALVMERTDQIAPGKRAAPKKKS